MVLRWITGVAVFLVSLYWGTLGPFGLLSYGLSYQNGAFTTILNGAMALWGAVVGYVLATTDTTRLDPRVRR